MMVTRMASGQGAAPVPARAADALPRGSRACSASKLDNVASSALTEVPPSAPESAMLMAVTFARGARSSKGHTLGQLKLRVGLQGLQDCMLLWRDVLGDVEQPFRHSRLTSRRAL